MSQFAKLEIRVLVKMLVFLIRYTDSYSSHIQNVLVKSRKISECEIIEHNFNFHRDTQHLRPFSVKYSHVLYFLY